MSFDLEAFMALGQRNLPGHLGIVITEMAPGRVCAELPVRECLLAPNGYLHAGTLVSLADTASGYGCQISLPEGAAGFTTLELKSNHLSTVREGRLLCVATVVHRGRTTQVWDAVVTSESTGKTLSLFRCTQMILYPAAAAASPPPPASP
ncbi:MAG: PaaI family thioesterase [Pseudomonadota bacterium]